MRLGRYRAGDGPDLLEAVRESSGEVAPFETWCHEGYTLEEAADHTLGWDRAWESGAPTTPTDMAMYALVRG